MKRFKYLVIVVFFLIPFFSLSQDYIFWGDYVNGNVYRSDISGDNIIIIATEQYEVRTVSVDNKNFRVYWAVNALGVMSANFDGSDLTQILNYDVNIGRIEFDYLNDRIYFTENFLGTIKSCNLDGTDIQTLVTGTGLVQGLGVDSGREYIFWGDQDSGNIYRSNIDGGEIVTIFETSTSIYDIELDVKLMKVYFSDRTYDKVSVMDYDGTNVQDLVNSDGVMGALSTDFDNEKMYWIERENGLILEANLDGTEITPVIYDSGSQFGGQDVSQNYVISDVEMPELGCDELRIFPNPCKDFFYIDMEEDAIISIYNAIGQFVLIMAVEAGGIVDVSELESGIYVMMILGNKNSVVTKLTIK